MAQPKPSVAEKRPVCRQQPDVGHSQRTQRVNVALTRAVVADLGYWRLDSNVAVSAPIAGFGLYFLSQLFCPRLAHQTQRNKKWLSAIRHNVAFHAHCARGYFQTLPVLPAT